MGIARATEHETDEILRAIAEPNRRAILQLVAADEMAVGQIAAQFPVTRPAISQHLAVLREAGLVTERVAGTRHLYRARPEGLAELREFLATMWPEALDRLKARAEETAAAAEMATIAGPTGGSGQ